jgi:hypothetical protein
MATLLRGSGRRRIKQKLLSEGGRKMVERENKEQFVQVSVVTTSGVYPKDGFEEVPAHQKIRVQLQKAAQHLGITDTTNWVAMVGNREINVEASYEENELHGRIEIDYGPREGGGGSA